MTVWLTSAPESGQPRGSSISALVDSVVLTVRVLWFPLKGTAREVCGTGAMKATLKVSR